MAEICRTDCIEAQADASKSAIQTAESLIKSELAHTQQNRTEGFFEQLQAVEERGTQTEVVMARRNLQASSFDAKKLAEAAWVEDKRAKAYTVLRERRIEQCLNGPKEPNTLLCAFRQLVGKSTAPVCTSNMQ